MMTRVLFMLFCIFLQSVIVTSEYSFVQATVYVGWDCKGNSGTYDIPSCINFPNWGTQISGIWIRKGSCVVLRKEYCVDGGEAKVLAYPEYQICRLPDGWNDHTYSLRACVNRNVRIHCPTGSYVRRIVHGDWHESVTIFCYKPTETTLTYSGSTGGKAPSNPITSSCPIAAHGHSWVFTSGWEMYHNPTLKCSRNFDAPSENLNVTGSPSQYGIFKPKRMVKGITENNGNVSSEIFGTQTCNAGQAFTGIHVDVDEGGGIKGYSWMCDNVIDPTSMCEPQESLGLILHCDNSESVNEMECSYTKTVGVGVSKTLTATERQEMTFSAEFGYSIESGIPGLSASMSASLGYSELVGYEWSVSDGTTWSKETTVLATIKVQPYTHSKLEQLIGKCSFYGTSTNYFKQTDVNFKTGETTISFFST